MLQMCTFDLHYIIFRLIQFLNQHFLIQKSYGKPKRVAGEGEGGIDFVLSITRKLQKLAYNRIN